MSSLLVHIGLPKTGSTAIQSALSGLRKHEALDGLSYPEIGRSENHKYVAASYLPAERMPRRIASQYRNRGGGLKKARRDWSRNFIKAISADSDAILSSEVFRKFTDKEVSRFLGDCRQAGFTRIRVLAYVRNPADLYASAMQQRLKASATIQRPDRFRCGYRESLEPWMAHGDISVEVRSVEAARELPAGVVQDCLKSLSDYFGRDLPVPDAAAKPRNRSMSAEAAIILQRYRTLIYPDQDNQFTNDSSALFRLLDGSAEWLQQTPLRLNRASARAVAKANRPDADFLRERFGIVYEGPEKDGSKGGWMPVRRRVGGRNGVRMEDILGDYNPDTLESLLYGVLARSLAGN